MNRNYMWVDMGAELERIRTSIFKCDTKCTAVMIASVIIFLKLRKDISELKSKIRELEGRPFMNV